MSSLLRVALFVALLSAASPADGPIQHFNGRNLDGLYSWLTDTKYEGPCGVSGVPNTRRDLCVITRHESLG